MENASKALIIAGAILISILLISIGIIVINAVNSPINTTITEAEKQAVEMFNAKFTGYAGTQQSASVKALMTAISSSNGSDTEYKITVSGIAGTPGEIQAAVNSRETYIVTFTYEGTNGRLSAAKVDKK